MKLRYHLEFAGLRLLVAVARSVSTSTAAWLGTRLGDVAFDLVRKRRKVALAHLRQTFPDEGDLVALARSVYRHLGGTAMEHARTLGASSGDIPGKVMFSGEEHLAKALELGRGAILITGHFGYWEMLGAAVGSLGYPITVVAKDQHNPLVNSLIVQCRERLGMRVVPMSSATRGVLKSLSQNECVGLLVDQDAGPGGVFVDFLGREASTYRGPVVFAARTGAPIIPCFILKEGFERHRVVFEPAIDVVSTGNDEDDIVRYTQAYTEVLERYVRDYPDHWFWVHRRWKTHREE
ncbi:MAG: lysophospholipid acyltransferase family protein [Candidatus Latescibacteria bacterium]|nr:lysophospholipid acyltransferase family protein [Candidatus Latescibacterota bacterium]